LNEKLLLKMENISKSFPGVKALDGVNFILEKGSIHGLLGENGAGKSTLISILTGVFPSDDGKIFIMEKEEKINTPLESKQMGIYVVYQELSLLPHLTVAENMLLDTLPKRGIFMAWNKLYKTVAKEFELLNLQIDVRKKVSCLNIAERQLVEITRAISSKCKILVLDEPTSALSLKDIDKLFKILKDLKNKKHTGIIFISHKLLETKEITDRATVLRDGKVVKSNIETDKVSSKELSYLIVGKDIKDKYPKRKVKIGKEALRLENVYYTPRLKNINVTFREGEIVGIVGALGSGKSEMAKVIFSLIPKNQVEGDFYLYGKKINFQSPFQAIYNRIGLIPESRADEGLLLKQSIFDNILISDLDEMTKYKFFIDFTNGNENINKLVSDLQIKCSSCKQKVRYLSGGNQQKVLLARWLEKKVKVLILDEPTRGIDVGAKTEIYKLMNALTEKGVSILLFSSEVSEVVGMSDRIYILKNGQIVKEVLRNDFNQNKIQHIVLGGEIDVE